MGSISVDINNYPVKSVFDGLPGIKEPNDPTTGKPEIFGGGNNRPPTAKIFVTLEGNTASAEPFLHRSSTTCV